MKQPGPDRTLGRADDRRDSTEVRCSASHGRTRSVDRAEVVEAATACRHLLGEELLGGVTVRGIALALGEPLGRRGGRIAERTARREWLIATPIRKARSEPRRGTAGSRAARDEVSWTMSSPRFVADQPAQNARTAACGRCTRLDASRSPSRRPRSDRSPRLSATLPPSSGASETRSPAMVPAAWRSKETASDGIGEVRVTTGFGGERL